VHLLSVTINYESHLFLKLIICYTVVLYRATEAMIMRKRAEKAKDKVIAEDDESGCLTGCVILEIEQREYHFANSV